MLVNIYDKLNISKFFFIASIVIFISLSEIKAQDPIFDDVEVQQLDLNNETTPIPYSTTAMAVVYYRLFQSYYVTIGVENLATGGFIFLVENFYFAHIAALSGVAQIIAFRFSLELLGGILGVPFSPEYMLRFYIHYATVPMENPLDYPFVQFDRVVQYDQDDADNLSEDPTDPTEPEIDDGEPSSTLAPVTTEHYYGCQVPNIDLDDGTYPDSPNYAGDKNACGPAAASNSMKWLSDLPDNGINISQTHREILTLLSDFMHRQRNHGVRIDDFIRGKLDFIAEFGLNINVKFQSDWLTDTVKSSFNNSFARNDNGTSSYPTWDWIKQEMNDGEDVELMYKWKDSDGNWRGHVVTLTGVTETEDGKKSITYKHDKKQGVSGSSSVVQEGARIKIDSNGRMIIHKNGRKKYVSHAVAESPGDPFTPVELTSFAASVEKNNVIITWETATEVNNRGFELIRNSKVIAFVDGNGTTSEKQSYQFIDESLASGRYVYELVQYDFDGLKEHHGQVEVYVGLPDDYKLYQNYPNPFNPSTVIAFTISKDEFVNLTVFNGNGEEVAALLNRNMEAGYHQVNFNIADEKLASGVYFYRIKAGKFTETKKMILLR
ncbi:MAG: T9SS type A sorting domain-containing protein [Chlorobi bacterium]|nr:T9SS type A sorting domain-containing protein [Chlorobiota bacterium]